MNIYLLKIRGDECPHNNITPNSWESDYFQLKEYYGNLSIIEQGMPNRALLWINESSRRISDSKAINGLGLSAIGEITNVDVASGKFKLENVVSFTKHLNLKNFLQHQLEGTFANAYQSQRVRVRRLDNSDLLNIISAMAMMA